MRPLKKPSLIHAPSGGTRPCPNCHGEKFVATPKDWNYRIPCPYCRDDHGVSRGWIPIEMYQADWITDAQAGKL